MPKFKIGETSPQVLDRKKSITDSIRLKSLLINNINCPDDIPVSLKIKNNYISQDSVHKWHDDQLGVVGYSRNTAHAKHNNQELISLLNSIDEANVRLDTFETSSTENISQSTKSNEGSLSALKLENERLKVALAEVYRAYMQLVSIHTEGKQADESMRALIKVQAKVLGKNRIREVE
ncbi:hypothetical protein [Vibrio vulnificus]|uniref:hypothetical protein n=1 Tax=Vibrio vulnificus TaxID=672 RepID=UPI003242186B